MSITELIKIILVLLFFMFLYMIIFMLVSLKNIKENWPLYRCNPMIMPFASVFGQDSKTNFTYCIQNIQTNFMTTLLQPLSYNLGVITEIAGSLTSSISSTRNFLSNFRTNLASAFGGIYSIFLNVVVEIQRMAIAIKDTMGKFVGILATLLYTLKGTVTTIESLWNGPPGTMVQALCFHPDTLLRLKNGEIYKMKNVPLLSELENGSIVKAILTISNCDIDGNITESLYNLGKGVDNTDILSTKSHLVFDKKTNSFVKVKDYLDSICGRGEESKANGLGETNIKTKTLSCLITSDHTIKIGQHLFHDWEDNNGSPSKNIP